MYIMIKIFYMVLLALIVMVKYTNMNNITKTRALNLFILAH